MANLKRAAALALSAAMLLQPMTASAVTWGNVVQAIKNYSRGQTDFQEVSGETEGETTWIQVDADGKATIKGRNHYGRRDGRRRAIGAEVG